MPEIESELIIVTSSQNVQFNTQTNGDHVEIKGLHLTREQAATLAWLINNSGDLKIKIKEK